MNLQKLSSVLLWLQWNCFPEKKTKWNGKTVTFNTCVHRGYILGSRAFSQTTRSQVALHIQSREVRRVLRHDLSIERLYITQTHKLRKILWNRGLHRSRSGLWFGVYSGLQTLTDLMTPLEKNGLQVYSVDRFYCPNVSFLWSHLQPYTKNLTLLLY